MLRLAASRRAFPVSVTAVSTTLQRLAFATDHATSGTRRKVSATHKYSVNTGDASGAGLGGALDEVPSYSSASHLAYLTFHARRLWLPVVMAAGYYSLAPLLAWTSTQQGLYVTACIFLQRVSIHGAASKATKDMTGHSVVVTGGTSGIGLYTAMQLLNMGALVVIASKSGKEDATRTFMLAQCVNMTPEILAERLFFVPLDFNDQMEVMAAAARIKGQLGNRLDLLVNCAAVWKEESGLTKQGFEEHIGVNFLGPFHFTEALLPSLRRSTHRCGRVVYVTCTAHNGVRTPHVVQERMLLKPTRNEEQLTARCYSASKLGNIFHAQSIAARRYEGIPLNKPSELTPVDVCCADPTYCSTNLMTRVTKPFFGNNVLGRILRSLWLKDALEGSQTVVNCCVRDHIEPAGYYVECRHVPSAMSRRAQDPKCRESVVRWAMANTIARYYTIKKEK